MSFKREPRSIKKNYDNLVKLGIPPEKINQNADLLLKEKGKERDS
ncbi:hypothetical protein LCGC14_1260370 [marine sediment metagenome]|uniref:Uncharacterized protein n=1 Tax=marine sediment metagenome TaxID=412755 RepID=A0A0F9L3E9_9ZZZZ